LNEVILPAFEGLISMIDRHAMEWAEVPMLAKTHGQPASPTLLGKEFSVWTHRLREQLRQLQEIQLPAKFGGATGNMNAHYVTFPDYDWHAFADQLPHQHHSDRPVPRHLAIH